MNSEIPKCNYSKRGRTQKDANERKGAQMQVRKCGSSKRGRTQKDAKEHKWVQKSANASPQ